MVNRLELSVTFSFYSAKSEHQAVRVSPAVSCKGLRSVHSAPSKATGDRFEPLR